MEEIWFDFICHLCKKYVCGNSSWYQPDDEPLQMSASKYPSDIRSTLRILQKNKVLTMTLFACYEKLVLFQVHTNISTLLINKRFAVVVATSIKYEIYYSSKKHLIIIRTSQRQNRYEKMPKILVLSKDVIGNIWP